MINRKRRIKRTGWNALHMIALGFAGIILLGSLLLSLPCAAQDGKGIGWFDALFTSTSAVCVTGLVVVDTGTTFSLFGKIVLLCLIQVGGLGFMTFATMLFRLIGRHISLRERMLIRESLNEEGVGGMVSLMGWVAKSAFTVEFIGAALLAMRFIPRLGVGKGIFYSIFHAVSAFCNAGFDLFGNYSSLTAYRGDVLVNFTIMGLIIIGGLGFGVLKNLHQRRRGKYLYLHTRIVLAAYGALFLFGTLFTLASEWTNPETLASLPFGEKLLAAMFQSVTLRTAGFNTINEAAIRPAGKLVGSLLMLTGAAPASTGGGVKVTTMAVILLSVFSTVRGRENIVAFKRGISHDTVRRALAVLLLGAGILLVDTVAISLMQPELEFMDILFECASAMGTVGVSAFGSASLNTIARIMIILTMYIGRIGPLTMALVLASRSGRSRAAMDYPEGHIMIG
ncbi:MAG: Trk family potassium uptake protein [Clostridia bacterium]|nr:Trk family potassium uptake protein [Clostridia bacterium]